jgi:hypothetical protein
MTRNNQKITFYEITLELESFFYQRVTIMQMSTYCPILN